MVAVTHEVLSLLKSVFLICITVQQTCTGVRAEEERRQSGRVGLERGAEQV